MSDPIPPQSEPDPNDIPFAEDAAPPPPPSSATYFAAPKVPSAETAPVDPLAAAASKDEITMGMLAHLLGIFTGFLGPLIIWLVKKDQSKYIDEQAKEALNFQIAAMIVIVGCLLFIPIPVVGCLMVLVSIGAHITRIVFSIIGTIEANKGVMYRYPATIRLIK